MIQKGYQLKNSMQSVYNNRTLPLLMAIFNDIANHIGKFH
jgi:hypothetical protein